MQYGEKIFKPLIHNLIVLEKDSLNLGPWLEVTKGFVTFILGDNLGTNTIVGFLTSFVSKYFCRFYLWTRDELLSDLINVQIVNRSKGWENIGV